MAKTKFIKRRSFISEFKSFMISILESFEFNSSKPLLILVRCHFILPLLDKELSNHLLFSCNKSNSVKKSRKFSNFWSRFTTLDKIQTRILSSGEFICIWKVLNDTKHAEMCHQNVFGDSSCEQIKIIPERIYIDESHNNFLIPCEMS